MNVMEEVKIRGFKTEKITICAGFSPCGGIAF
jgi:hypothetical protein